MAKAAIVGTGHFLPDNVVTNDDLAKMFDTSDEWIQQRTGIRERRFVDFTKEPMGASDLGARAASKAIESAGLAKEDIDLILYATLSPDLGFPGDGVLVQAKLDMPTGVPAMDIRNQCSGFLYGLSTANAFIRSGVYKNILLIGAEVHSTGLDFSDRGRDVAVLFGDGAAAVVLSAVPDEDPRGIIDVTIHADGRFSDALQLAYPSSAEMPRLTVEKIQEGVHYPQMNGKLVFKNAVTKMPEALMTLLARHELKTSDIDLLIPHQANLRIAEMVQKRLELSSEQVFNNIMHYGNTTAASIPLALDEAIAADKIQPGGLLAFAAFGAGFTWGAALVRL